MNGPPASLWDMNAESAALKPDAKAKGERGTGRETKFDELTANAAPVEQWHSARPPLPQCTQQVFLNDLIAFLTVCAPAAAPVPPRCGPCVARA